VPFVSKSQKRFMFAKHPKIAKRFAAHTPKGKRLPERVKRKSRVRNLLLNVYCATGPGGGKDPTCGSVDVEDLKNRFANPEVKLDKFGRQKNVKKYEKERRVLAEGISSGRITREFEEAVHKSDKEILLIQKADQGSWGNPFLKVVGGERNEVDLAGEDIGGAIVSHNHPDGHNLSLRDFEAMIRGGAQEIRAVTPGRSVYSIKTEPTTIGGKVMKMADGSPWYDKPGWTDARARLADAIKKVVTPEEAKLSLEEQNRRGLLDRVWTEMFKEPWVIRTHGGEDKVMKLTYMKGRMPGGSVVNVYCATGPGGGKDPTCSTKQLSSSEFKAWFKNSKVVDSDGKPLIVYHGTTSEFTEFKPNTGIASLDEMLGAHFAEDSTLSESFLQDRATGGFKTGGHIKPVYLSIQNPRIAPQRKLDNGTLEHDAYAINRDIRNEVLPHEKQMFVDWITKSRMVTSEQGGEIFDRLSKGESIGHDEYNGVVGHDLRSERRVKGEHPIASYVGDYDSGLLMLSDGQRQYVVSKYKDRLTEKGYDGIRYEDTAPMERGKQSQRAWIAFRSDQIKSAIGNRGTFDSESADITNASYPSTHLLITDPLALQRIKEIQAKLDPDDVVELKDTLHITVLYGLETIDPEVIKKQVEKTGPVWVSLGRLSLFQNEDADVLKLSVRSLGLEKLHYMLSDLPNADEHAIYQAHMTIALLKPGTGYKYTLDPSLLEWQHFVFTELEFSPKKGEKVDIKLNIGENCGIGSSGFQRGNTCARGRVKLGTVGQGGVFKDVPGKEISDRLIRARDSAIDKFRSLGIDVAGIDDIQIVTEENPDRAGAYAVDTGLYHKHNEKAFDAVYETTKKARASGEVPLYAFESMEDRMIHEIGHNIGRRMSQEQNREWESLFKKYEGDVGSLPSFYAQENSSEMFAESVLAIVKGYRFGGTARNYEKQNPDVENFVRRRLGLRITTNVGSRKAFVNPLRIDPTRTTTLRNRFAAEITRRFKALNGELFKLIVERDVFGLTQPTLRDPFAQNVFCPTGKGGGVDPTCSPKGATSTMIKRLNAGGAFTFLSRQRKYKDIGTPGFAVSPYPDKSRVFSRRVDKNDLKQFMKKNSSMLEKDGHGLGVWYDPESKRTFLDVIIVTESRNAAKKLGREHDQISIFDFKRGKTIATGGTGGVSNESPIDNRGSQYDRRGVGSGAEGSVWGLTTNVKGPNCGIASGGFQPGNTCARGGKGYDRSSSGDTGGDNQTGRTRDGGSHAPPVGADGTAELTHWSNVPGLETLDPAKYGTAYAGAEKKRRTSDPENWVDRTYYGIGVGQPGGYQKEQGLGKQRYTARMPFDQLYDFRKDPDGLFPEQYVEGHDVTSIAEKRIKEAGYKGYWVDYGGFVAAVFEKLPVEKHLTENWRMFLNSIANVFCPTGEGGGVDPSCSSRSTGRQIDSPEFKAWFKDSKVVDDEGKPLVVYHGTGGSLRRSGNFVAFDTMGGDDFGSHFGSVEAAQEFADDSRVGAHIKPVYLSIQNPLRLPDLGRFEYEFLKPELKRRGVDVPTVVYEFETDKDYDQFLVRRNKIIATALKKAGYDGIVYSNAFEGQSSRGGNSFIALDPRQIKSAIGNRGTFDSNDPIITHELVINDGEWSLRSFAEKLTAFRQWLTAKLLDLLPSDDLTTASDRKWWEKYVKWGFEHGAGQGFDDVKKAGTIPTEKLPWYRGTREEFLRDSFRIPESVEKVQILASRTFDELKGVTDDMRRDISRILSDGLVKGQNPHTIAKTMADQVIGLSQKRATVIARTEIVRAHNSGKLASFRRLGVKKLGVLAEWSTAGDGRVCEICKPMEGVILDIDEAEGLLPIHPCCRCTWRAAGLAEDESEQIRTRKGIRRAVKRSLRAGGKKWAKTTPLQKVLGSARTRVSNVLHNAAHAWPSWYRHVDNVYCATGKDGGKDPTCSKGGGSGTFSSERAAKFVATPLMIPPGGLQLSQEQWKNLHGPDSNIVEGRIAGFPITTTDRGLIEKVSKKTIRMLEEALSDPGIVRAMVELNRDISVSPFKVGGRYAPQRRICPCANENVQSADFVGILLVMTGYAMKKLSTTILFGFLFTHWTGVGGASRIDEYHSNTVQVGQKNDPFVHLPHNPRSQPFAKCFSACSFASLNTFQIFQANDLEPIIGQLLSHSIDEAFTSLLSTTSSFASRDTTSDNVHYRPHLTAVMNSIRVRHQFARSDINAEHFASLAWLTTQSLDPQTSTIIGQCSPLQKFCAGHLQPMIEPLVGSERNHNWIAARQAGYLENIVERTFASFDLADQRTQPHRTSQNWQRGWDSSLFRCFTGSNDGFQSHLETVRPMAIAQVVAGNPIHRFLVQLATFEPQRLDIFVRERAQTKQQSRQPTTLGSSGEVQTNFDRKIHLADSNAAIAALVALRPRLCPYNRAEKLVRIATRSSIKSCSSSSARLITSILNGQIVSNQRKPNRVSRSLFSIKRTSKSFCNNNFPSRLRESLTPLPNSSTTRTIDQPFAAAYLRRPSVCDAKADLFSLLDSRLYIAQRIDVVDGSSPVCCFSQAAETICLPDGETTVGIFPLLSHRPSCRRLIPSTTAASVSFKSRFMCLRMTCNVMIVKVQSQCQLA
jgi:SPP1 gp7 family putative phage head morphogenesis protein